MSHAGQQRNKFTINDVEVKETRAAYKGFFKVDSVTLRHKRYEGGWTPWFSRECLDRGHAAAILLFDPRRDEVVLIEQFRVGALQSEKPWLLEVVAGMIDKENERDPLSVVLREAQEEAGVNVGRVVACNSFLPSPGGMTERVYMYVGEVDATQAHGVHGLDDEQEDICVVVLSREEAYALVQRGEIDNAAAIISLQWLELNHQWLKAQWL